MAVFLLFAALLGVTRADASLPKAADIADLSRPPALQLPAVAPSEPSRFGFADDVALLNVEKEVPRFSLIEGVETRRFERTYARNNPLKYVDPDGKLALPWHFVVTYQAARAVGMGFGASARLALNTMMVDLRQNSQSANPDMTHMHAMRGLQNGAPESIESARLGTAQSMRDSIYSADLPAALHTAQDAPDILHADKVWKGEGESFGAVVKHALHDMFPSRGEIQGAGANTVKLLVSTTFGQPEATIKAIADPQPPCAAGSAPGDCHVIREAK